MHALEGANRGQATRNRGYSGIRKVVSSQRFPAPHLVPRLWFYSQGMMTLVFWCRILYMSLSTWLDGSVWVLFPMLHTSYLYFGCFTVDTMMNDDFVSPFKIFPPLMMHTDIWTNVANIHCHYSYLRTSLRLVIISSCLEYVNPHDVRLCSSTRQHASQKRTDGKQRKYVQHTISTSDMSSAFEPLWLPDFVFRSAGCWISWQEGRRYIFALDSIFMKWIRFLFCLGLKLD